MTALDRLTTPGATTETTDAGDAAALYQAFAPDGEAILGTVVSAGPRLRREDVSARARILPGTWAIHDDGEYHPLEYGEYEPFLDTTTHRHDADGQPLYDTRSGREWPENRLVLVAVTALDDPDVERIDLDAVPATAKRGVRGGPAPA
jgi:hypothetical protein